MSTINGNGNGLLHADGHNLGSTVIPPVKIEKDLRKKKKDKKKKKKKDSNIPHEEILIKEEPQEDEVKVEIEYVTQKAEIDENDPAFADFARIFLRFSSAEDVQKKEEAPKAEKNDKAPTEETSKKSQQVEMKESKDNDEKQVSKKEKKRQKRMEISVLKSLVQRPEVVEVHDVNSSDPHLLVHLKSYRNSVPIPKHWSQKRKYLQGKRGIEKSPFQLPDFIAATGIQRIRESYLQKEDTKKSKQKQREKMQPKMGKIDIDYQVLHDAFFKFQTKPKLTIHGDLYYEGKEFEIKLKEKRPGDLSPELKKALGVTSNGPPPWLINMQRYGPPPSYPNLKIPGLNAPIPPGASFGYAPGEWGKPPVNERGEPLYGDVFGSAIPEPPPEATQPIERKIWGELEEEEEEEEEEEQMEAPEEQEEGEKEAEEAEEIPEEVLQSGISSVPEGVETPDTIDLRKNTRREEEPKQLFQVLEAKETAVGGGLLGSAHKYVVGEKEKEKDKEKKERNKERVDIIKSQKSEKIAVTLNPSDLENLEEGLNEDLIKESYEKVMAERKQTQKEDVSDLVAEQERKKKRKKSQKEADSKSKKYKDFKF